jgi:hypothetical protein
MNHVAVNERPQRSSLNSDLMVRVIEVFTKTVFGQSTILLTGISGYILAFSVFAEHFKTATDLKMQFGKGLFWIIFSAPPIIIFFSIGIPLILRIIREHRIKETQLSSRIETGYFRLHPYSVTDADFYRRLDRADV